MKKIFTLLLLGAVVMPGVAFADTVRDQQIDFEIYMVESIDNYFDCVSYNEYGDCIKRKFPADLEKKYDEYVRITPEFDLTKPMRGTGLAITDISEWRKNFKDFVIENFELTGWNRQLAPVTSKLEASSIEEQSNEIELKPDNYTQAISMILALKASGEPITLEKLLPIILLLRS